MWERVPPLNAADRPLMTSSSCSPVPVITLSSAAHVRTIDTVTLSPSPSLSSANSSLLSSPSTSMCNSDLETDVDMAGGDLNGNSSSQVAKRRMVQKKMTGKWGKSLLSLWGHCAFRVVVVVVWGNKNNVAEMF